MGVKPRKSPVKGGRRKASDLSRMDDEAVQKDTMRILAGMKGAVGQAKDKCGTLLSEMRRIPAEPTEDEMMKLISVYYFPARDAVYFLFGCVGGVVKRVNELANRGGGEMISRMPKTESFEEIKKGVRKVMGMEEANFKLVQDGVAIRFFENYRDAVRARQEKYPLSEVRPVNEAQGKKKNLAKRLPWSDDPEVPDI